MLAIKYKIFLINFCLFILISPPLFSQYNELSSFPPDSVFIINSFVFDVDGITRPFALINAANFISGEELHGVSNFEEYLQEKTQLLINQRTLDSARIEYSIGGVLDNGKYPVDLIIFVKDTWNIIVLPYPKYDSNDGFELTLKARDYNFLGTMQPLRIDLGYRYDRLGRSFYDALIDTGIPFEAFGLSWNVNFENYFTYRPDLAEPFYYQNVTGINVNIPVGSTTLNLGFEEAITVNDEISADVFQTLYFTSRPYFTWRIPTGIDFFDLGDLTYNLRFSAVFNHELPQYPLPEYKLEPVLNFSHSLGFGRFDWIGNFKNGIYGSISNSYGFYFYNLKNDLEPLRANLIITGVGHFILNDFMGISTRLMYRHYFNYSNENAGDILRGILVRNVTADYMLSLNFEMPFRVLRFKPSEWLNNSSWRIIDFDLHLVPIIDAALVNNISFNPENLLLTAGLEFIGYPDFFRSMFFRVAVGFNISGFKYNNEYEIFLGMEFFY